MPVFKSKGAAGAWVNGEWNPVAAEAVMAGTEPPPNPLKAGEVTAAAIHEEAKIAVATVDSQAEAAKNAIKAQAEAQAKAAEAAKVVADKARTEALAKSKAAVDKAEAAKSPEQKAAEAKAKAGPAPAPAHAATK